MTNKHTPGPWNIVTCAGNCYSSIQYYQEDIEICRVDNNGEGEANAAFIVRACNSHDALVEALEVILADSKNEIHDHSVKLARAAIAKARRQQ